MSGWRGVLAVLSAFCGIRKRKAVQDDSQLRPWQLIITALLLVLMLIGLLLALARWIGA
ncbi:hypothetical protein DLM_3722 [Aquitalea magnusonii]|uniref:DUF2970 domain-containing protein n=1 Tax=Aquitalea magnusonii TaxID=332411 RepID=A0A3G9GSK7_9NEIS|nr:DUF2970 domain-containing protein [Aquitalea magnusonii]BBF87306.1 hypothetical protein DLM_3722 [Aquitalea magnusonii]